jgi:hypothetical protein
MSKLYTIEILNKSLGKITEIINPYPLNNTGHILRFSNELSHYGMATFRVSTKDTIFDQHGDIVEPHKYHVRIRRNQQIVWQGAIIDNPIRNKVFIEVTCAEYLFYFDKKRVQRDSSVPTGWTGAANAWQNYRYFGSGTMATAVTNVVTEMKNGFGANHILANMTIGTIENPVYPDNFIKSDGTKLSGQWNFSSDIVMQFDYHSVLHVLKSFGNVSSMDFELTNDLVFNFKKFIGTARLDYGFTYGTFGNIIDYNLPRYGKRMVNDMYGLAADDLGNAIRFQETDSASINTYGLLEGSNAYLDITNANVLKNRLSEELRFLKSPTTAPVNVILDDKTYSLGTWKIGDVVYVKIKDNVIDYNANRRIVGITTTVHNTGKELVAVQTNEPKEGLF